jgi:regulatory protein
MPRARRAERLAERRALRAALTDPQPVVDAAAAFVAVRPRSVTETRRRMRRLGYPDGLIDQVVERFIEVGFLDDAAFARTWVESRDRARPRGASALRRELALKGVARDVVDEVLVERADSTDAADPDRAAAVALLERRRAALTREADPRRRRQKAYALLARNGFDPETCREVSAGFASAAADDR